MVSFRKDSSSSPSCVIIIIDSDEDMKKRGIKEEDGSVVKQNE
jgi:hypothetical protein